MRTMLLSFKPHIYDKIHTGDKIFEHRLRFPDEPVMAYMYVSKPRKIISGIVYLDSRIELASWLNTFSYDSSAVHRIEKYLEHYKYVMPVLSFQETNEITLSDMKEKFPSFVAPQSYLYLDDKPELLEYIQSNLYASGYERKNSFTKIDSTQVCRN